MYPFTEKKLPTFWLKQYEAAAICLARAARRDERVNRYLCGAPEFDAGDLFQRVIALCSVLHNLTVTDSYIEKAEGTHQESKPIIDSYFTYQFLAVRAAVPAPSTNKELVEFFKVISNNLLLFSSTHFMGDAEQRSAIKAAIGYHFAGDRYVYEANRRLEDIEDAHLLALAIAIFHCLLFESMLAEHCLPILKPITDKCALVTDELAKFIADDYYKISRESFSHKATALQNIIKPLISIKFSLASINICQEVFLSLADPCLFFKKDIPKLRCLADYKSLKPALDSVYSYAQSSGQFRADRIQRVTNMLFKDFFGYDENFLLTSFMVRQKLQGLICAVYLDKPKAAPYTETVAQLLAVYKKYFPDDQIELPLPVDQSVGEFYRFPAQRF